jgi:hypothetical protein
MDKYFQSFLANADNGQKATVKTLAITVAKKIGVAPAEPFDEMDSDVGITVSTSNIADFLNSVQPPDFFTETNQQNPKVRQILKDNAQINCDLIGKLLASLGVTTDDLSDSQGSEPEPLVETEEPTDEVSKPADEVSTSETAITPTTETLDPADDDKSERKSERKRG